MDIHALLNHDSPSTQRFNRLQKDRSLRQPTLTNTADFPPPRTRAPELTRDQKIEMRTLRTHNKWTYSTIAKATGHTIGQVRLALTGPLTPQKHRCGKKPLLRTPQKTQLREFLAADRLHRELPWPDLRWYIPGFELYGEQAIRTALRAIGYRRQVRKHKIHLTDRHKAARLTFAYEQLSLRPNPEDWETVLFSDETWATTSYMWKKWVTIHDSEDEEAFALVRAKPHGWMFWGSFAGAQKGPSFFWEKEYGGITAEKYRQHIIPLVHNFLAEQEGDRDTWIFQQDNAPSHAALETKRFLYALDIQTLVWPAKSPDLSPIEDVWFWMKSWIEINYPNLQWLSLAQLRVAIGQAWEALDPEFLRKLAHSMPRRLQQVISNNGGLIKY